MKPVESLEIGCDFVAGRGGMLPSDLDGEQQCSETLQAREGYVAFQPGRVLPAHRRVEKTVDQGSCFGRSPGQDSGIADGAEGGAPVRKQVAVIDDMAAEVTAVSLRVEHRAEPEQQAPGRIGDRSRAKRGVGGSSRQRSGHLQRIAKHENGARLEVGDLEYGPPEGEEPTDSGILERDRRLTGKLLVEQGGGLVAIGLAARIGEPVLRDRRSIAPVGAG